MTGYRALYDYIKGNCDVYITGSNACFMSEGLATPLSGCYVELKMMPLSFREFCSGLRSDTDNYPKLLLTLDKVFATADYDGIQKRNLLDWLLEGPPGSPQV